MSARRRNLLDHILVASDSCLCIVDARRRIRFFSPGMEAWTGWDASKVEGLSCDGLAEEKLSPVDLLAAAFNPSASTWKGQVEVWQAVLPAANGGTVSAQFCSIPLSNETGQFERVLMIRSDMLQMPGESADHAVGQELHAEVAALRADFRSRYNWDSFIGADKSLVSVRQLAGLLRGSDSHFNIVGDSGTGRRHLAECIHVGSHEAESSFVPVRCDLLSTEALYEALHNLQHMAADRSRTHEHPGMLLLIDVDRMPREVQQWLLDQLTNYQSVRLASTSSVPLNQLVTEGWMLPEFQQLIAPVEITLPRLHARGNDVLLLAHEFVQLNRRLNSTTAVELSQETAAELLAYHWPGNVRELQRVIYEACEACSGEVISPENLPFAFRAGMDAQAMAPAVTKPFQSLADLMQSAERRIIEVTLSACSGNKTEVARRLGLTRPSLYRRLKSLGLEDDKPPTE